MSEILNSALITRRRSEMGLSQRALSLRLSVGTQWVHSVEAGRHRELSLRNVSDLADALGLDIVDLLERPKLEREPEPDDVRIEAALVDAGRFVADEELADLFGWTLRRTREGLDALEERLTTTGQRLHRVSGTSTIRMREGVLGQDEQQGLAQRLLGRSGLAIHEAQFLRKVLARRVGIDWERHGSYRERLASGSLMKKGLIERVDNRFVASDEVRYSLGLTESPGPTARRKRSRATRPKRK